MDCSQNTCYVVCILCCLGVIFALLSMFNGDIYFDNWSTSAHMLEFDANSIGKSEQNTESEQNMTASNYSAESDGTNQINVTTNSQITQMGPNNDNELAICDFDQRSTFVDNQCKQTNWTSSKTAKRVVPKYSMIDKFHNLIYCNIPKAGSISFRTFLGKLITKNATFELKTRISLNNSGIFYKETGIRLAFTLNDTEIAHALNSYKRLIIVRHPFDRLRSAYDDKLAAPGILNRETLKGETLKLVHAYFKSKGFEKNGFSFDPSEDTLDFSQFLELVATQYHNGFKNEHWTPMTDLCNLCRMRYDYILRIETMNDDMKIVYAFLRKFVDDPSALSIPHKNMTVKKRSALTDKFGDMHERFKDIDRDIIEKLMNLYDSDLQIFGYQWDIDQGGVCKINVQESQLLDTCC